MTALSERRTNYHAIRTRMLCLTSNSFTWGWREIYIWICINDIRRRCAAINANAEEITMSNHWIRIPSDYGIGSAI
ncbi:hypothetical protein CEXT_442951 [Caerostris extrusa]|uniref:Uncharacterized protein n=1 Tax=Caerostris extrusa TaxID=172846 RepID=A0AAV4NRS6_CAEEX|nr:hypothetical protein CEXT_442951 [Caerostris extrusa]